MHLAFFTSAYRTIVFHELGKELAELGHVVHWISPNRRWRLWLEQQGVPAERILDLTDFAAQWRGHPLEDADRAELNALETAGGWQCHDLVQMDDLLSRRPAEYTLRYLAVCARHTRRFLEERGIRIVFGEQTWAAELLTGMVCRQVGAAFLRPISTRIPDNRFVFFRSHYETDMVTFRAPGAEELAQAQTLLANFRARPVQPYYMGIAPTVWQFRWQRLKTLVRHLWDLAWDPYDETSLRPTALLGKYLTKAYRVRRNRWFEHFEPVKLPAPRPFVLFTLHQEPEATIDVWGSPFSNQIESARALARTLPVTHELWVKEHRVALSNREPRFYAELRAIPGVKLIDPWASSFDLIRHAALVAATTGTIACEAAVLGTPSVTLRPTSFSPILRRDRFNPYVDSLAQILAEADGKPNRSDAELVEYFAWLWAQSWPGHLGDAFWQPSSLDAENVRMLARGFDAVCRIDSQ